MSLGDLSFFWKISWSLAGRSLSLALWKLGLPGGFALVIGLGVRVLITVGASEIGVGPRMMAPGSDSGGSESWLKYLNSSPVDEGGENTEAEPASRTKKGSDRRDDVGPSSVRRLVDSVNAPETSSGWSGSWIERWLNPGDTSSASNEGRQPEGDDGATSQPTRVMEPAPEPLTPAGTREKLRDFLNSFRKVKSSQSFLDTQARELGLEGASQEKLGKIIEEMDEISRNRVDFPLSGQNAAAHLVMQIWNWEKKRG